MLSVLSDSDLKAAIDAAKPALQSVAASAHVASVTSPTGEAVTFRTPEQVVQSIRVLEQQRAAQMLGGIRSVETEFERW